MGLHAAIIRLSPLIHEGEQRYKPYKVGDPRTVTLPLKNPGYAPGQTKFRDRVSSCITDRKVINIDFSNCCLVLTIINSVLPSLILSLSIIIHDRISLKQRSIESNAAAWLTMLSGSKDTAEDRYSWVSSAQA